MLSLGTAGTQAHTTAKRRGGDLMDPWSTTQLKTKTHTRINGETRTNTKTATGADTKVS